MNMFGKSLKSVLGGSFLLLIASSSQARDISYDYVQGSYGSLTDSTLSVDLDADVFSFGGSFSLSPNVAAVVGFSAADYDRVLGIDLSSSSFSFGIVGHQSIAPATDVYAGFAIVLADGEASDGFDTYSDDDTGNTITLGLRHMASETAELGLSFSRADVFDDTANMIGFNLLLHTDEKLSFGVGFSTGDDVDVLSFSVRINL